MKKKLKLKLDTRKILVRLVELGMDQNDLAAKIGVHCSAISRWVSGKNMPSNAYIKAIADALGLGNPWSLVEVCDEKNN